MRCAGASSGGRHAHRGPLQVDACITNGGRSLNATFMSLRDGSFVVLRAVTGPGNVADVTVSALGSARAGGL